jgi:uncharacterized membrane protein
MRAKLLVVLHVLVVTMFGFFGWVSAAVGHPLVGLTVFFAGVLLYTHAERLRD